MSCQREFPRFILADARNPYNIGACARAMANFGFSSLALVNVFSNDFYEAKKSWQLEAEISAVDSSHIINKAKFYSKITEATSDCDIVLGTSSLHRQKPERDVIKLSDLHEYLLSKEFMRPAIVFGCEKHGLTKEQLSYCNAIVNIPTSPQQPSINLGQAVALFAYELSKHCFNQPFRARAEHEACPAEIEHFALALQNTLIAKDGEHWKESTRLRYIRQALIDAHMTASAVNALKALLR